MATNLTRRSEVAVRAASRFARQRVEWRKRISEGSLLGPRWTILWGPNLISVIEVTDEAQGRRAVRQAIAEGADLIEVYSHTAS